MRLSARRLNRTLLLRQHLLERVPLAPAALIEHLVGLQAQESLPPYLGLAARLTTFDPYAVSRLLESGELVRLGTLRGTIHLQTPADASRLRAWCQPVFDAANRVAGNVRVARDLAEEEFEAALVEALAGGPLPLAEIATRLAAVFPDVPSAALGGRARNSRLGLAQLPPRGLWKRSGGVVYDSLARVTGRPLQPPTAAEVEDAVRRYLRAFGPASAADAVTWSGVTGLGPVLAGMADLVRHEDESGKALWDIPDGVYSPTRRRPPPYACSGRTTTSGSPTPAATG